MAGRPQPEDDERMTLARLNPEEAPRALLKVNPEDERPETALDGHRYEGWIVETETVEDPETGVLHQKATVNSIEWQGTAATRDEAEEVLFAAFATRYGYRPRTFSSSIATAAQPGHARIVAVKPEP